MERGDYSEISQYLANSRKEITNHKSSEGLPISTTTFDVSFLGYASPAACYTTSGLTDSFTAWPTRETYGIIPLAPVTKDTSAWYLSGGEGYVEGRLAEVSYAALAERVNNNRSIQYTTISIEGKTEGNYRIRFVDNDRIEKVNRLLVDEDTDKPDSYKEFPTIGFVNFNTQEPEVIFRHRGKFEPKARNVLEFWCREDEEMTVHHAQDFLLANTRIAVEYPFIGEIRNLFHSKVADQEILKISSDSSYKSLYPFVGEVAIDHKDYFTFSSNWDNNYYDRYTDTQNHLPIEGTFELYEQKAFLGSKLMNVPKAFEIHTFIETEVSSSILQPPSSSDVSTISVNVSDSSSVLQSTNRPTLVVNVDARARLLRAMLESGASLEFERLRSAGITRFAQMDDSQIRSITTEYLETNIIPLYTVTDVIFYAKSPANQETDQILRIDLTEAQKQSLGYFLEKNTRVDKLSDFIFQISQELDTKNYRSFSVSIKLART
jgi:hypothetical protein